MVKIQYGIAGFFSGVFIGFLIALFEMRLIDYTRYPTRIMAMVAFTIMVCAISGIVISLKILKRKK